MNATRPGWWLLCLLASVVTVSWLSAPGDLAARPDVPASGDSRIPPAGLPVDPFTATPAELCLLPGIGPHLARRLHREIHHRDLTTLAQLSTVAGIGPARLRSLHSALQNRRGP